MIRDIAKEAAAYEADRDRYATKARQEERRMQETAIAAVIMSKVAGKDQVNALAAKVDQLRPGEARFAGPDGVDGTRHRLASGLETGFSFDPMNGACFALKTKVAPDEFAVIALSPADMVVLVDAMTAALATIWNERSLFVGYDAARVYEELLETLAEDRLNIAGTTQAIHRQARAVATAEKEAAVAAMEKTAEDRAARRVASAVRKLSLAASMPAGLERSALIEESQQIVRKAFGGADD